jgi:16S rRNA (cytidine1402-2'-O)-methyltransferase
MAALYVVATPIGNLEDVTLRALRLLAEVDLVACEDTRRTRKLLEHHGIHAALTPFHSYNMKRVAPELLRRLSEGESVALVSDGGTPGISDPGAYLVGLARERGLRVVPVPGASALCALLSVSGWASTPVTFAGFLSPKGGRRRRQLQQLLQRKEAFLLFEAPHRILRLLSELAELGPERRCLVGRELTKIHEEFMEGIPGALLTVLSEKTKILGEFSIVVAPAKKHQVDSGR